MGSASGIEQPQQQQLLLCTDGTAPDVNGICADGSQPQPTNPTVA